MANQKKEALNNALYFLLPLAAVPVIADYIMFNGFYLPEEGSMAFNFLIGMMKAFYAGGIWKMRLMFAVAVTGIAYLAPFLSKNKGGDKRIWGGLWAGGFVLTVIGYSDSGFWSMYGYPAAALVFLYATNRFFALLSKGIKEEGAPSGISSKDSGFMFEFPSSEGTLKVHIPQMNFWVEAGPGGGKSESVIGRVIQQAGHRGYPGLIYDFEGDPREPGAPMLNKIGFTAVKEGKRMAEKNREEWKLSYSFINFTDVTKTVRVNPLAPRYIENRLDVQDLVQNLMTNLSVNKDKGGDFWEKYGTAYIYGISWMLVKNYRDYATVPHVVSVALNDIDTVLRWASEDEEVKMIMSPLVSAWNKGAEGQLAGAETSAQLPISILFDPNIFWVLSEDSFDLDITRADRPCMLGIGNSKKLQQALAPAISAIITVIMKQMNSPGKAPSIFCIDEFPTVKVNGVDTFIATARKHKVATILALQDFDQAVRDYGDKSANILRTACGNMFFGLTGNTKTAEFVSNMFGEIKRESVSLTTSTDSQSTGTSLQREKTVQPRDVMIQSPGHMMGKIAGGEPPLYSLQFDRFEPVTDDLPQFSPDFRALLENEKFSEEEKEDAVRDTVMLNYKAIIKEAKDILAPYTKEAAEEKARAEKALAEAEAQESEE